MQDILSIDRFEGNYAVCIGSDGRMIELERATLPEEVKEGDCIVLHDGIYAVERVITEERRQEALRMYKALFE